MSDYPCIAIPFRFHDSNERFEPSQSGSHFADTPPVSPSSLSSFTLHSAYRHLFDRIRVITQQMTQSKLDRTFIARRIHQSNSCQDQLRPFTSNFPPASPCLLLSLPSSHLNLFELCLRMLARAFMHIAPSEALLRHRRLYFVHPWRVVYRTAVPMDL